MRGLDARPRFVIFFDFIADVKGFMIIYRGLVLYFRVKEGSLGYDR